MGAGRRMAVWGVVAVLLPVAAASSPARADANLPLLSSITQYGITWTFSQPVPVGQFVNGDYYVVGPATIASISPLPVYDSNGITRNGSVLNLTTNRGYTGFDDRLEAGRYRSSFDAHLPISISPGDALVSSVSVNTVGLLPNMFRPSDHSPDPIQTAAVLTCLSQQVPADTFRPSYLDRGQTQLYHASDLQWGLLPNLSLQGVTMRSENFSFTIDSIADMFQRPWLDTIEFGFAAPMQNMPVYGREVARLAGVGTLLLESNYTQAEKQRLLVNMVQVGIDHWGIAQAGYYGWEAFGGHNSGREWLMIFAGLMLGDSNMAHPNQSMPGLKLQEDMQTIYQNTWTGMNVAYAGHYGTDGTGEYGPYENLWPTAWASDLNENYRRCCTSLSWVGEALGARLLGATGDWNHTAFFDYVDRWMADPNDATARAILQQTRGLNYADYAWENQTWDPFVMDMWNKYRGYIAPLPASNWWGAAGNWSDANNWPAGEPNAALSACVTNGGSITLTQAGRTCKFLAVGGVSGEAGTVTIAGGSIGVGSKVRVGPDGTLNLQSGSILWTGGDPNQGVSVESDGILHVTGGAFSMGRVTPIDANYLRGRVQVDANSTLCVLSLRQDQLSIGGVLVFRGPKRTSVVNSLDLARAAGPGGAWTGKLDIGSSYLLVKDGNALASIAGQVRQGSNFAAHGSWDGEGGITSSAAAGNALYAVGFADNAILHRSTFGDANNLSYSGVLVRFTYVGDTNLDGITDLDTDYYNWSFGYLNGETTPGTWYYGDFNYDGEVDLDKDYYLWSFGYLNQGGPLVGAAGDVDGSSAGAGAALDAASVPEPSILLSAAIGGIALLRRRGT